MKQKIDLILKPGTTIERLIIANKVAFIYVNINGCLFWIKISKARARDIIKYNNR